MRAHGQRKCAGIGAPLNEELVKSKIPAEGWRAGKAPVPSLLVGPTTTDMAQSTPEGGIGARVVKKRPSSSAKLSSSASSFKCMPSATVLR